MNLRDLEYLLALAETGHFGSAAVRCHVTQPTLSTQIAKLEKELGVDIFERGRYITPTATGREVIAQASVILDEVRRLQQIAQGAEDPLTGLFRLGVIHTVGPYLLPTLLPLLQQACPELKLYIREGLTAPLLEQLHHLDLDAVLLSTPFDEALLDSEELFVEDFVAAFPVGHPLVAKELIEEGDLTAENLLLLEEGHCMREQTLRFCEQYKHRPRKPFQASSIESLRQMVSAGLGCTLLPALATVGPFAAISPIEVRPFAPPVPRRRLVLAWRRHSPLRGALRHLAQGLREQLAG